MECPLCISNAVPYFSGRHGEYFSCPTCSGVFLDPADRLDPTAEQDRYTQHNNDINDPGYQAFVSPIVEYVLQNVGKSGLGLDFGCGTGPVVSFLLEREGYVMDRYDPFFFPDERIFSRNYDFVICCEVIEHFYSPLESFTKLASTLKRNGQLICMTDLLTDEIDFGRWYYKEDPTHVFFYREETIGFILARFGFSNGSIRGRLIVWTA